MEAFKSIAISLALIPSLSYAFCGFFVSKAGTDLFNNASKVVIARDKNRTVMTMASDYSGEAKEFAMVVPVPTILEREQIHIGNQKDIEHLDAYTAPRLVEYFDPDPCRPQVVYEMAMAPGAGGMRSKGNVRKKSAKELGVTIEAKYTVGEYDILILSAKQSDGLVTWLKQENYKVPKKAEPVVSSYLKQGLKFFVAKVNLKEKDKLGYSFLRPLQMAYESNKFMIPIRLGMANSKGKQDLFIFALSKNGRVETTNYRTVKIPSDVEIPTYVKSEFKEFYKDMFSTVAKKEEYKVVFTEYAWDMGWCDPCAADPLSREQLKNFGVFWLNGTDAPTPPGIIKPMRNIRPQARNVYVTRMHLRYDNASFPEDLRMQVTNDRKNFQGRYIMRHAFKGEISCKEGERYKRNLQSRYEKEATNLSHLTGWDINTIRKKMNMSSSAADKKEDPKKKKWWNRIWGS